MLSSVAKLNIGINMLTTFLPAPLVGIIALFLYAINLIATATILLVTGLITLIIPYKPLKKTFGWFSYVFFPTLWVGFNNRIMRLTTRTQWDIQTPDSLDLKGRYLMVCNHQSWLDILVLESVFYRKLPMLKFFMKKELLWLLPIAGVVCWILGFPFMQRYSKSYLKKHPEKKGKDLETTRRACEKFKDQPIAIINFVEGTRCTPEKQQNQASPYQHLLTPKAGAFAFAMAAMQNHLSGVIDATIVYPASNTNTHFWRFLCGKMPKIVVYYRLLPMTAELKNNNDSTAPEFTRRFQMWLNEIWRDKDALIETTLQQQSS
jgi:1-acyl-sn-glycerol-3-phosphate acyltransferase